jgi:hypothetical protein
MFKPRDRVICITDNSASYNCAPIIGKIYTINAVNDSVHDLTLVDEQDRYVPGVVFSSKDFISFDYNLSKLEKVIYGIE